MQKNGMRIELSDKKLGDNAILDLANFIPGEFLTNLTLHLDNNNLSSQGILNLISVLAKFKHLKYLALEINNNHIGDQGVEFLANFFNAGFLMRVKYFVLGLAFNRIKRVTPLVKSLYTRAGVQCVILGLRGNKLFDFDKNDLLCLLQVNQIIFSRISTSNPGDQIKIDEILDKRNKIWIASEVVQGLLIKKANFPDDCLRFIFKYIDYADQDISPALDCGRYKFNRLFELHNKRNMKIRPVSTNCSKVSKLLPL